VSGQAASSAIDMRVQPPWRWSEQDPELEVPDNLKGYERMYELRALMNRTYTTLVEGMTKWNIRAVVQSEPTFGSVREWNDRVAATLRRDRTRFIAGFGAADPCDAMTAIGEMNRCYHELGLRGLSIMPDFFRMDLADKHCYPLFAKAAELKIPVGVHVGVNFSSNSPIRHGHPSFVDEIACDFPDLTIICNHGGWPWPVEMIAVAWKHSNVYLEFGAISPRYMATPDGGWGPMRHFMNSVLQDRILFGSDWPMLSHDRLMEELALLELKDSVLEKFVCRNAEALLNRILG
jgi:uncharacterized protein